MSSLRLGSLQLRMSASTLFTVLIVAAMVYPSLLRGTEATKPIALVLALGIALFLILGVFLHELSHALVARVFGHKVREIALNVWGGHTQYEGDDLSPGRSFAISLAGPMANFTLAGLSMIGFNLSSGDLAQAFWWYSILLNVSLGIFNLVPGLPLDGGRMLEAVLWKVLGEQTRATTVAAWCGRAIAALVLITAAARALTDRGEQSMLLVFWGVLIAGILWMGASDALRDARVQTRLDHLSLTPLMRPVVPVPGNLVLDQLPPGPRDRILVVDQERGLAGRLDGGILAQLPKASWQITPVAAVTRPIGPYTVMDQSMHGRPLAEALTRQPSAIYIVTDHDGQWLGAVETSQLNNFIAGSDS
ncbi:M50 family metallopeptidase [Devriesea agamarum]|uniref:M50 family metallopeptidase n=1 Tax=Devriesea agamarum TaxID=472569 RepID=UPI00155EF0D5|nr:M50 family metallopeptidase [Devriesea agamarum]